MSSPLEEAAPSPSPSPPARPPKDLTGVTAAAPYLPYAVLSERLLSADATGSPPDNGRVSLIVLRPQTNARRVVEAVEMSAVGGVAGSGWVEQAGRGTTDQVCVMSTAAIRAIAGEDEAAWPAAGDQLFLDFDLSKGNLRTGDRVGVGRAPGQEVVLEVTTKPHNGCAKFARRYGDDALKVVNAPAGKERRLRGIYFRVVGEGVIRRGDRVRKLAREDASG